MCMCMVDVRRQTVAGRGEQITREEEAEDVEARIWERHDPRGAEVLSQEEFLVWTVNNPYPQEFSKLVSTTSTLVSVVLSLLERLCVLLPTTCVQVFQLCHVVLGLRPLMRKDEGQIVRGWLEREDVGGVGRGGDHSMGVGFVWHLISMDWWTAWHNYVNHHDSPLGSRATAADLVSNRGRGSRKTPSIESTLASDADKNVVATSYQQLSENENAGYGGSLGRRSNPSASLEGSSNSSSIHTPTASPHPSRKNSSSNSSLNGNSAIPPPPRPGN